MPTSLPEKSVNLVPLGNISSRPEAMARCIGPLMAFGLVSALDRLREAQLLLPPTAQPPEIHTDIYSNVHAAESYLSHMIEGGEGFNPPLEKFADPIIADIKPSPAQLELFSKYTAAKRDIGSTLADTMSNYSSLAGQVIIPGILAVKGLLPENKDAPGETTLEVVKLLRSRDMSLICRSMSFSANGAYGVRKGDVDDALPNLQHILREYSSDPNTKEPLSPELLTPLKASELFEVEPATGRVKLALIAIRILRKYLKLDNQEHIMNNGNESTNCPASVSGSRGCPVSIKTIPMAPDDLTNDQRTRLTTGKNPIARYNGQEFTLLRSPIDELNFAFADILESTIPAAKA